MGGLVLFALVTWVTFSSSYSDNKFAGVMNIADRFLVDGFGFCGAICVAPNLHAHVNKTLYQCQASVMDIVQETRPIQSEEEFYNLAIKRQGAADSRLCSWSHSVVDGCVGELVKNQCHHDGIKQQMTRMMREVNAYVCSNDPPMMECALHPEMLKNAPLCAAPLQLQFGKYFNGTAYSYEDHIKQFQRFYNAEIKTNNAESLYSAFKTLGTCLSSLIGKSSVPEGSCSKVKDIMDGEIDQIIAYFKKTDMLSCNFNPELWRHLGECGQTFGKALMDQAAPRPPYDPSVRYDPMAHSVDQFRHFADENYQLLKDPLKAFSTCVLQSVDTVCGQKWTYNVMETKLTLIENLFNPKDKSVPAHCEQLIAEQQQQQGGSAASTSKMAAVTVVTALLLRHLITY